MKLQTLALIGLLSAGFAPASHAADRGDRAEERLDRRGDRIDRRLDRRGDRFERRFDRRAGRPASR